MRFVAGVCVGFLLGAGLFVWAAEANPSSRHAALDGLFSDYRAWQVSRAHATIRREHLNEVGEE